MSSKQHSQCIKSNAKHRENQPLASSIPGPSSDFDEMELLYC